jgi:hypothetical protein
LPHIIVLPGEGVQDWPRYTAQRSDNGSHRRSSR